MAAKIFETVGKVGLGLAVAGGVVNSALYNGERAFSFKHLAALQNRPRWLPLAPLQEAPRSSSPCSWSYREAVKISRGILESFHCKAPLFFSAASLHDHECEEGGKGCLTMEQALFHHKKPFAPLSQAPDHAERQWSLGMKAASGLRWSQTPAPPRSSACSFTPCMHFWVSRLWWTCI